MYLNLNAEERVIKRPPVLAALLLLKPTTPEEEKQEDKESTTRPKGVGSDTWRCVVFLTLGRGVRKAIGEVGAVEHRGILG